MKDNTVKHVVIVFSALILVIGIVLALFLKGNITGLVVEGDASSIVSSGTTSLTVLIDGNPLDSAANYSGTLPVVIADAGLPIVSFNFNFDSNVLNLSQILIDKVPGAIAVNGVPGPKSVYVESEGNTAVCVRDVETTSVGVMTEDCSSPLEFVMVCDGSTIGSYYCIPDGTRFVVGGLIHSAVKSTSASPTVSPPNATPVPTEMPTEVPTAEPTPTAPPSFAPGPGEEPLDDSSIVYVTNTSFPANTTVAMQLNISTAAGVDKSSINITSATLTLVHNETNETIVLNATEIIDPEGTFTIKFQEYTFLAPGTYFPTLSITTAGLVPSSSGSYSLPPLTITPSIPLFWCGNGFVDPGEFCDPPGPNIGCGVGTECNEGCLACDPTISAPYTTAIATCTAPGIPFLVNLPPRMCCDAPIFVVATVCRAPVFSCPVGTVPPLGPGVGIVPSGETVCANIPAPPPAPAASHGGSHGSGNTVICRPLSETFDATATNLVIHFWSDEANTVPAIQISCPQQVMVNQHKYTVTSGPDVTVELPKNGMVEINGVVKKVEINVPYQPHGTGEAPTVISPPSEKAPSAEERKTRIANIRGAGTATTAPPVQQSQLTVTGVQPKPPKESLFDRIKKFFGELTTPPPPVQLPLILLPKPPQIFVPPIFTGPPKSLAESYGELRLKNLRSNLPVVPQETPRDIPMAPKAVEVEIQPLWKYQVNPEKFNAIGPTEFYQKIETPLHLQEFDNFYYNIGYAMGLSGDQIAGSTPEQLGDLAQVTQAFQQPVILLLVAPPENGPKVKDTHYDKDNDILKVLTDGPGKVTITIKLPDGKTSTGEITVRPEDKNDKGEYVVYVNLGLKGKTPGTYIIEISGQKPLEITVEKTPPPEVIEPELPTGGAPVFGGKCLPGGCPGRPNNELVLPPVYVYETPESEGKKPEILIPIPPKLQCLPGGCPGRPNNELVLPEAPHWPATEEPKAPPSKPTAPSGGAPAPKSPKITDVYVGDPHPYDNNGFVLVTTDGAGTVTVTLPDGTTASGESKYDESTGNWQAIIPYHLDPGSKGTIQVHGVDAGTEIRAGGKISGDTVTFPVENKNSQKPQTPAAPPSGGAPAATPQGPHVVGVESKPEGGKITIKIYTDGGGTIIVPVNGKPTEITMTPDPDHKGLFVGTITINDGDKLGDRAITKDTLINFPPGAKPPQIPGTLKPGEVPPQPKGKWTPRTWVYFWKLVWKVHAGEKLSDEENVDFNQMLDWMVEDFVSKNTKEWVRQGGGQVIFDPSTNSFKIVPLTPGTTIKLPDYAVMGVLLANAKYHALMNIEGYKAAKNNAAELRIKQLEEQVNNMLAALDDPKFKGDKSALRKAIQKVRDMISEIYDNNHEAVNDADIAVNNLQIIEEQLAKYAKGEKTALVDYPALADMLRILRDELGPANFGDLATVVSIIAEKERSKLSDEGSRILRGAGAIADIDRALRALDVKIHTLEQIISLVDVKRQAEVLKSDLDDLYGNAFDLILTPDGRNIGKELSKILQDLIRNTVEQFWLVDAPKMKAADATPQDIQNALNMKLRDLYVRIVGELSRAQQTALKVGGDVQNRATQIIGAIMNDIRLANKNLYETSSGVTRYKIRTANDFIVAEIESYNWNKYFTIHKPSDYGSSLMWRGYGYAMTLGFVDFTSEYTSELASSQEGRAAMLALISAYEKTKDWKKAFDLLTTDYQKWLTDDGFDPAKGPDSPVKKDFKSRFDSHADGFDGWDGWGAVDRLFNYQTIIDSAIFVATYGTGSIVRTGWAVADVIISGTVMHVGTNALHGIQEGIQEHSVTAGLEKFWDKRGLIYGLPATIGMIGIFKGVGGFMSDSFELIYGIPVSEAGVFSKIAFHSTSALVEAQTQTLITFMTHPEMWGGNAGDALELLLATYRDFLLAHAATPAEKNAVDETIKQMRERGVTVETAEQIQNAVNKLKTVREQLNDGELKSNELKAEEAKAAGDLATALNKAANEMTNTPEVKAPDTARGPEKKFEFNNPTVSAGEKDAAVKTLNEVANKIREAGGKEIDLSKGLDMTVSKLKEAQNLLDNFLKEHVELPKSEYDKYKGVSDELNERIKLFDELTWLPVEKIAPDLVTGAPKVKRIIQYIGSGKFGKVFIAEVEGIAEPVALKVRRPDGESPASYDPTKTPEGAEKAALETRSFPEELAKQKLTSELGIKTLENGQIVLLPGGNIAFITKLVPKEYVDYSSLTPAEAAKLKDIIISNLDILVNKYLNPAGKEGGSFYLFDISMPGNIRINRNTGEIILMDPGVLAQGKNRYSTLEEAKNDRQFEGMYDGVGKIKNAILVLAGDVISPYKLMQAKPPIFTGAKMPAGEVPKIQRNEPLKTVVDNPRSKIVNFNKELGIARDEAGNVWYVRADGKHVFLGTQKEGALTLKQRLEELKRQEAAENSGELPEHVPAGVVGEPAQEKIVGNFIQGVRDVKGTGLKLLAVIMVLVLLIVIGRSMSRKPPSELQVRLQTIKKELREL